MALVKNSSWPSVSGSWISDFFDDDRFFNFPVLRGGNLPAINVKENERNYEVEIAAPGMNKEDFNISIDQGILTVVAEQREEREQKEKNFTRREFECTSFSRSFNLPADTNEEDIEAHYENGILNLAIAKKDGLGKSARKDIEIR